MTNVGYHIRNGWQQKPPLGVQLNWAHPLTNGLVGCWMFNEGGGNKAYDLSGYGNHGTLENMAFPSTTVSGWNPGRTGRAITFDCTNDYINCGNDSSLNITDAITVEAWVKIDGLGITQDIARKNDVYALETNASNYLAFQIYISGTGWITHTGDTTLLTTGIYYHMVGTYDKNNQTIDVFINGQKDKATGSQSGDINTNGNNLYIGYTGIGPPWEYFFNGSIDGVKIYNRALSAEEIQQLYIDPYGIFEPATKYTIVGEALRTKHVGSNVAAMQMLRGCAVI